MDRALSRIASTECSGRRHTVCDRCFTPYGKRRTRPLQHDEEAAAANNLTWVSYTVNRPHCPGPTAKSSKSADHRAEDQRRTIMLGWAITFLVIALIAAILGFGVVAGTAAAVAAA